MYNVLIVHGAYGSQYGNWFPWLEQELSKAGLNVLVPQFPTGDMQSFESWAAVLDSYSQFLSDDLLIFSHSAGPEFLSAYLQARQMKVRKAVFVVPFFGPIGIKEFDDVNQSFVDAGFTPQGLSQYVSDVVCIYSDNDPYVPIEMCREFTRQTGAVERVVPQGGHLNTEAGYTTFPLLLEFAT